MSTTEDTNAARRGSGSNDLLGPLPSADWMLWCHNAYEDPYYSSQDGYTADDMRAYAAEQVVAERERCAKLVETQDPNGDYGVRAWFDLLAAKIRA